MKAHESHELLTTEDFTKEEIERRNLLAIAVIEEGLLHCKHCGAVGSELAIPCGELHGNTEYKRELIEKIKTSDFAKLVILGGPFLGDEPLPIPDLEPLMKPTEQPLKMREHGWYRKLERKNKRQNYKGNK